MEGLIEGRIVHYVLPAGNSKGEHRPAIIVRVFESMRESGTVNLQVFTDGNNDVSPGGTESESYGKGITWATSVHYDENKESGTWHWIERA